MRQRLRIPNFKNLGTIFRILVLVNGALIFFSFASSQQFSEFITKFLQASSITQPALLLSMASAYVLTPFLHRLRYINALLVQLLVTLLCATGVRFFLDAAWLFESLPSLFKVLSMAGLFYCIICYYFYLLDKAYSPAIQEARIQALQARIRPHFLFNSMNTALSLIRLQPKQAETALEDMADLFRVLMADNRDLVPLAREIALCKQYLALEKLRLEERLTVEWLVDETVTHALVPALILQPLLENAVYHGIEPHPEGGNISIHVFKKNKRLHIHLQNPYFAKNLQHQGNKMAISNIKERLHLHFDLEAALQVTQTPSLYQVKMNLPCSHN